MFARRQKKSIITASRPNIAPAQVLTLPAPVGGLNARDSIAAMPATDAVILDNFFPSATSVDLRSGYRKWSTGYPAAVESLMPYNAAASSKLFAASATSFYDATTTGAVGAAVVTGLTNARWQHTNMGTPGGQFLYCVNGVDSPQVYDGSKWQKVASVGAQTISSITRVGTTATLTTAAAHGLETGNYVTVIGTTPAGFSGTFMATVTGPTTFTYVMAADPGGNATVVGTYVVAPAITGVDPKKLIHVNLYANRMFFVEKDSARVWYLAPNAISGAAQQLDFSSLMTLGGYIMAMATWTIDNAAGVNEYAVFITSEGEILMYSGTDPSSASSWVKNGRYRIGRPVGRRCFARVDSDIVLITDDGLIAMSQALLTDRGQNAALSNKIITLITHDVSSYRGNFGWQVIPFFLNNKLIVNVPTVTGMNQYQYVMNQITGAWCRFVGWNANVFETQGNNLYFGSNLGSVANSAYVAVADTGNADDGGYIFGEAKPAFQYFGAPGRQKQITMAKPLFQTSGNLQVAIGIDIDFNDKLPSASPSFTGVTGAPWNITHWNSVPWGSPTTIKKDWQGLTGVGDAAALHIRVANNRTTLKWQAVEYVYRMGAIL